MTTEPPPIPWYGPLIALLWLLACIALVVGIVHHKGGLDLRDRAEVEHAP